MEAQATYNYKVVRQFSIMTVVWGIVGMLVGVIIAAQLVWPDLTYCGVPGHWRNIGLPDQASLKPRIKISQ